MAAKLVNGATLSQVFNFDFSYEHKPLDAKKLAEARDKLSELHLIIIDEMSMVSADMLYMIHLRLCEIFQSEDKFANIGIVLVGDLLQLPPIQGRYIFQEPKNVHFAPFYEVESLWHSFEVIDLKENHRQGDELTFSTVLNKMRVGIVDSDVEALLRTRLLDEQRNPSKLRRRLKNKVPIENGKVEDLTTSHVFYTNEEVNIHNNKMLNLLSTPLLEIEANYPPKFKPKPTKNGTIAKKSQFRHILTIKDGARVMMIYNIDTIDGLVNGSLGNIVGIEEKNGEVQYIIAKFDDGESGDRQRRKYPGLSAKYEGEKGTPIQKFEFDLPLSSSARIKIKQFPLTMAWGITCHKMQGQTVKKGSKLIIHWHAKLKDGMAYVM